MAKEQEKAGFKPFEGFMKAFCCYEFPKKSLVFLDLRLDI